MIFKSSIYRLCQRARQKIDISILSTIFKHITFLNEVWAIQFDSNIELHTNYLSSVLPIFEMTS